MSSLIDDGRYADAVRKIEHLIALGTSFEELEDFIDDEDALPGLDEEQRSALWFFALMSDVGTNALRRALPRDGDARAIFLLG